jgi:HD-GYP domain-containing protein (c-di-GMP phosphodiesterase class II)
MRTPLVALSLGTGAVLATERGARKHAERLAAALLETLLNAIDANDPQTGAHVRRVARYALILADAADLDERQQHSVERVALFHDIGKIHEALFDIIHEASALTPAERRAIATHPQRGADVLQPLAPFYPDLPEGVLSHHERWDGKGYPRCLAGDDIPIAARIVAIADTFDAITHRRRYREGGSAADATTVIASGCGSQWDPDLVDLFLCPPVHECVMAALHEHRQARKPSVPDDRRRPQRVTPAPDVRFRWQRSGPEDAGARE